MTFIKLFAGMIVSCTIFVTASRGDDLRLPSPFPAHPRLFLTLQREAELKAMFGTDPFFTQLVDAQIAKANRLLDETVTDYRLPDGKRLLPQCRRSLERTTAFAFAYRMTGKQVYADAAIDEMLAVCRFKDWNPSHYPDTAEMATSVGLGYDWLYEVIPKSERAEIRAAIVTHALKTGLPIYEKREGWTVGNSNWTEVCNAGLTIGALAIADEEPEIASKIIGRAIQSLPSGLTAYAPDGAYPEGPRYWSYGASFTGLMLRAIEDVFGSDFVSLTSLLATPGLSGTGDYLMGMLGPCDLSFNYADSVGADVELSPMMFALARWYQRPAYAVWLRESLKNRDNYAEGRLSVLHAVWYLPEGTAADFTQTPLASKFRGIQDVCTMRTAWGDTNAAFLGFKGGNNRANHGHLDIGSFVYEVNGVRWVVDLGRDDYNLPEYFGKQRWNYFRLNNRSHNTLVIGDQIQNPAAICQIVTFESGDTSHRNVVGYAVVDMTSAYAGQATSVLRTVTLYRDGTLTIDDTLTGVTQKVRWGLMTQANITIDAREDQNNVAMLAQGGKRIRVVATAQPHQHWEVLPATPPTSREAQNEGFALLVTFAEPQDGKVSLRVVFSSVE